MRTVLKTMVKRGSRIWEAHTHPSLEAALLHWLAVKPAKRIAGFVHFESAGSCREPTDAEIDRGTLFLPKAQAKAMSHRTRTAEIEDRGEDLRSNNLLITDIEMPWRAFRADEVISLKELDEALRLADQICGGPGPSASARGGDGIPRGPGPGSWRTGAAAAAAALREDVVDAEFVEIDPDAPPSPPAYEPEPVEAAPAGIDAASYRGALRVCLDLSPASGPGYRGVCEEAAECLRAFLSGPAPATGRRAARTAGALLHALPRHFPSAESAGKWAMEARPAIGAFQEAAFAWASAAPVASLGAPSASAPAVADAPLGDVRADGRGPTDASSVATPEAAPATGQEAPAATGPGIQAELPIGEPVAPAPSAADASAAKAVDKPRAGGRGGARRRAAIRPPEAVANPAAAEPAAKTSAPAAPKPSRAVRGAPAPVTYRPANPAEGKVLKAMAGRRAQRKTDIAVKANINRGYAVKIVSKLVQIGVCHEVDKGYFLLGPAPAR